MDETQSKMDAEVRKGMLGFFEEEITCPISYETLRDPVVFSSGVTVERSSADQIIAKAYKDGEKLLCPITRREIELNYYPNILAKNFAEFVNTEACKHEAQRFLKFHNFFFLNELRLEALEDARKLRVQLARAEEAKSKLLSHLGVQRVSYPLKLNLLRMDRSTLLEFGLPGDKLIGSDEFEYEIVFDILHLANNEWTLELLPQLNYELVKVDGRFTLARERSVEHRMAEDLQTLADHLDKPDAPFDNKHLTKTPFGWKVKYQSGDDIWATTRAFVRDISPDAKLPPLNYEVTQFFGVWQYNPPWQFQGWPLVPGPKRMHLSPFHKIKYVQRAPPEQPDLPPEIPRWPEYVGWAVMGILLCASLWVEFVVPCDALPCGCK